MRQVPDLHTLQQMAALLLAESVPSDGKVLVLGASGRLELKVFAERSPASPLVEAGDATADSPKPDVLRPSPSSAA